MGRSLLTTLGLHVHPATGCSRLPSGVGKQARGGQAAVVERAALAESDQFLRDAARGFGFGQRGDHSPVGNEAANQVGQHRVAMLELAAQLGGAFEMSHKRTGTIRLIVWPLPWGPRAIPPRCS